MYPHAVELFGLRVGIWNLFLVLGIAAGYPVLRAALACQRGGRALPRLLVLRWLATAYVSALGAQLFAYAFDRGTSLTPPPDMSALRYYLDPLVARKTLYGAIVFLPVSALAISRPWRDLAYRYALDAWTPAMFTALAFARVGCLLQGCCYGVRSDAFGLRFPPGGDVHWAQAYAGLVGPHDWSLPVVPTQLLEAAGLAALAFASFRGLRAGREGVFVWGVIGYSLLRFVLEALRDDPARNALGPLSTSQWIALAIVGAAVASRLGVVRLLARSRA